MAVSEKATRIGTMVRAHEADPAAYVAKILPHGFESLQPFFWQTLGGHDLATLATGIRDAIGERDVTITALGVFGNPLEGRDEDLETLDAWRAAIDHAHLFGATVVAGFTGRVRNRPLEDSLPRLRQVFAPLAKRAADRGVKIAFENCPMDGGWATGDWNIAHNPAAWELIFNELPFENVGLEWEPCHQWHYLIDPVPQLRTWVPKIFHVHGKDATVDWDVVRTDGVHGRRPFSHHRTPGFGDTNWTEVISLLRLGGYTGPIDIEGWHDPVYRGALEMTGQVHGLNYLKRCRGGDYVPNPGSAT